MGAVILQQISDLSDEETMEAIAFNGRWHCALDIHDPNDENSYLCLRTLWKFRTMATKENVEDTVFQAITDKLRGHFEVETDKQRIDSVHVFSNMKKLGRIKIFATTIKAFLTDMDRRFPSLSADVIPQDLRERYLGNKGIGFFQGKTF